MAGHQTRTIAVRADGAFHFTDLAPAMYRLAATSPEGGEAEKTVDLMGQSTSISVRLVLQPRGKVVGSLAGLSLDETAALLVRKEGSPETVASLRGVGNEDFEVVGIPEGRFVLVARSTTAREASKGFRIEGSQAAVADITFVGTHRLWGRILFNEQSVGGVDVVLRHPEPSVPTRSSYTKKDGAYSFAGLTDGSYEVVVRGNRFDVEVRGNTEADLRLAPYSLSGRVWAHGEPLVGRHVMARYLGAGGAGEAFEEYARPDRDGTFRLEGLPEGRYAIVVMDPFWEGAVREAHVNTHITGFDFHLLPTRDLREIRIENAASYKEILVGVRSSVYGSLETIVPMDDDGVGWLPANLRGAHLRLSTGLSSAGLGIPSWNGEATVVQLQDER